MGYDNSKSCIFITIKIIDGCLDINMLLESVLLGILDLLVI